MMFSLLALLTAVQIADAQDLFIPARQLRGSANASIDVPVETTVSNTSLTLSAEAADSSPILGSGGDAAADSAAWGWHCTGNGFDRTIARGHSEIGTCNYRGKGLDGSKQLGVWARFRSTNNDALRFHIEVGHMDPRYGCIFEGKVAPSEHWDYPYANAFKWMTVSRDIPGSNTDHFKRTCMRYKLECVKPNQGHDECYVEVEKIEMGEAGEWGWPFR